jgi:hypothetical protein
MNAQQDRSNVGRPTTSRGYLNAVLTANAVLLGVIALGGLGITGGFARVSHAQNAAGEDVVSMISAADQRKQMITELRNMSQRLDKIDATLAKGINVNVKNFPANMGNTADDANSTAKPDAAKQHEVKKIERPAPRTTNIQPK